MPPTGNEERLLCRRVSDLIRGCARSGRCMYLGFLDERQQSLAVMQLNGEGWQKHLFFGGFPSAERKVLAVYREDPPQPSDFPIRCIHIAGSDNPLEHRDCLGAVLALGIERNCIGDILPAPDGAWVMMRSDLPAALIGEIRSVGRQKVSTEICAVPDGLRQADGKAVRVTVASERLDALIAAVYRCNRADAAEMIRQGRTMVNHISAKAADMRLEDGDLVTVRGSGRFRVSRTDKKTSRGRIVLNCTVYGAGGCGV